MATILRIICDSCHCEIPEKHPAYKGHWRLGWTTGKRHASPMWDLCCYECVEDKLKEWLHEQRKTEANDA